jgi:hypothetical protein
MQSHIRTTSTYHYCNNSSSQSKAEKKNYYDCSRVISARHNKKLGRHPTDKQKLVSKYNLKINSQNDDKRQTPQYNK